VPLQSEVDCISDYIALQQLRLSKKVNIDFSVHGDTTAKQITPLVLIPFVENVFKYGISSHEESKILIRIHAEEKEIRFFCQNKIFPRHNKVERTGIGIENTEKRLELVYDGQQTLNVSRDNGLFTVQLAINL
jgi:LytS/YehU family sensor histidine kinase